MNIATRIEESVRLFPSKAAVIFENNVITYQTLNERVHFFACVLMKAGIKQGDRVALLLPNIPEFMYAYFGTLKLGAIAVSLNVMLKKNEINYILSDCDPSVIITIDSLRENIPEKNYASLSRVLLVEKIEESFIDNSIKDNLKINYVGGDEPAAIIYSSGTTGFPKGVVLSHANVISNTSSTARICGITQDDRLLLCLPMFHCFGQNFIMNSGFLMGATLVMQRRYDFDETLLLVSEQRVSMFFGVPTIFIHFLNARVSLEQLSSVRYFFTAGSSMPKEISQSWYERYSKNIYEGYGLTEASPFATYNHSTRYKYGSVGAPIENVAIKVVNNRGDKVSPNIWGEVLIKGPNVMLGYWNNQSATQDVLQAGWLRTGDVGFLDEEGYLYICDRIKDVIITSGFNVYSAEVENVIYSHPSVAEVAVFGIKDDIKGEIVAATVVLEINKNVSKNDLVNFCRQNMAAYKVPRVINFVDKLPKNASGKVLKTVLRRDKQMTLSVNK